MAYQQVLNQASRANEVELTDAFACYQISFACEHTGKYIPSSKRRITWKFGQSNVEALLAGKKGSDCGGEENELQLIWSVRSGKTKLVWNNQDLTSLVPRINNGTQLSLNHRHPPSVVEFKWRSGSGHMLEIVAHSVPSPGNRQYDLIVDGRSFFALPSATDLGEKGYISLYSEKKSESEAKAGFDLKLEGSTSSRFALSADSNASRDDSRPRERKERRQERSASPKGSFGGSCDNERHNHGGSQVNVPPFSSLCGESHCEHHRDVSFDHDELIDELQSDLYSKTLENLRDELVAAIPETESMISLAIINAFSEEDEDVCLWGEKSLCGTKPPSIIHCRTYPDESPTIDAVEIEANALWEAVEWMKWNGGTKMQPLMCEEKYALLQKQVNIVVAYVRYGILSSKSAKRIVQSVASVLQLDLSIPLPRNTVILTGLRRGTKSKHVRKALRGFGEIDAVAVASGGNGFAICRFRSNSAVRLAADAAFRNAVDVDDVRPNIFELHSLRPSAVHPAAPDKADSKVINGYLLGGGRDVDDEVCAITDKEDKIPVQMQGTIPHLESRESIQYDCRSQSPSSLDSERENDVSPLPKFKKGVVANNVLCFREILEDESIGEVMSVDTYMKQPSTPSSCATQSTDHSSSIDESEQTPDKFLTVEFVDYDVEFPRAA